MNKNWRECLSRVLFFHVNFLFFLYFSHQITICRHRPSWIRRLITSFSFLHLVQSFNLIVEFSRFRQFTLLCMYVCMYICVCVCVCLIKFGIKSDWRKRLEYRIELAYYTDTVYFVSDYTRATPPPKIRLIWKTKYIDLNRMKLMFGLVLWHVNHCRLFNAKSIFIHINSSVSTNSI